MGGTSSNFLTEDLLDEYCVLTYLSRSEILQLYKIVCKTVTGNEPLSNLEGCLFSVYQIEDIFPQLKYNPFKERIYRVFSSNKDGRFSFEDILDLCSVMSEKCPDTVKAAWAFRIFDFDEDNVLNEEDLTQVIDKLDNGKQLDGQSRQRIIDVLVQEMDLEANGSIGKLEFEHAVGKMSEFSHSFCFRL